MHRKLLKNNLGFTLLELTIVIGIVTLILAVSTGIFFVLRSGNVLDVEAERIVSTLHLARNRTYASSGLNSHGVHFDTVQNTYTLFSGDTFDSLDPDNEQNTLGGTTEFLNIQLEGAGVDVIYDRLVGTTSNWGFVEISNTG